MSAKIHIHTKYSLMDAMIEPKQLVSKIKELGDTALCVTEHGNVYSNVELYKECIEQGIKYLYGVEAYICDDVNVKNKDSKYHHLVIIAKNETGRLNLNKLVSESCKYKYYGRPRIDFDMLTKYHEGLIVSSACMAGEIQRALSEGKYLLAKGIVSKYKDLFGDDYYLEYQSHSSSDQQILNRRIIDLANELDVKYIVTTDAHYLNKEDQKYHSIFVQIGQAREVGETYNDCYVQSDDEILSICKSTTREENLKALATTEEIANKCNVNLPLSAPIMPHVSYPNEFDGKPIHSEVDYLKALCIKGWYDKKINLKPNKDVYKKRLAYEMNAIVKMGFEGYFLLVYSYCNSVERRGIARGSAGGSLVCYLSNITNIDPIEYGLYFERFIDVGALDLLKNGQITKKELKIPDVDSDFGVQARQDVLNFVIDKYGSDKVVSLGSFQYIWAKGAIKDIGRVLNIPFEITNMMTSRIDKETIQEVIELGLLDDYRNQYPELFEYAERLAGLPKSFSAHPCGKVICMQETVYYNAVDINDDGLVILQGDMHTADDLGLIKADFLGLRTVDVIYDTLEMIGKTYEFIAPYNLNFNDEKVLDNFRKGFTAGIFQFESNGMRDTLKKVECSSINDLSVCNALFRPGSIDYIDNYANRKKGTEEFTYLNPDLEPILSVTYGIIVFQEQLIEIGRLAKLSNPDELRKATAKKKAKLLDKIKPELYNGLMARGWTVEQLDELWATMLNFARYSFNKSHSSAYAIIAYICMYLKTYYPKEFICAWINSVSNKIEKVGECITEARRLGINIILGDYKNCSPTTIVYDNPNDYRNGSIMMGTNTIKFCNANIATELMSVSKSKHNSFVELVDDIVNKTSIDTRQLKILTGLGFFNEFGTNKKLLSVLDLYFGVKIKNKTVLPSFRTMAQISKSKIESYIDYGLTEYLVEKYAGKKTEKQYKDIDNVGLMSEMTDRISDDDFTVQEQVKFEFEHLQYALYCNAKISEEYYVVINYRTNKDVTKPLFTARNLCTGEEINTRIRQSTIFKHNPFGEFAVLKIAGFTYDYKKKCIDGTWQKSDELEAILERYEVMYDYSK